MKKFLRFLGGMFVGVGLCLLSLFVFKPDSFAATTNAPLASVKDTQQKSDAAVAKKCPQPQCGVLDYGSCQVDSGIILKGSYLYWNAREDGLDFVQSIELTGLSTSHISADVQMDESKFKWTSGFQAGLGYIFPQRQQWDVFLNWTRYNTHVQNSISIDPSSLSTQMLRATWLPFLLGTIASNASARWTLHFNTLDLSFGREFFIGKWFSVHPKAGARGAWIHQKYQTKYNAFDSIPEGSGLFLLGTTSFNGKWQYNAGGLRVGSDFAWHLNRYLSIVGNAYGSALYGKFKVTEVFDGGFVIGDGMGGFSELDETISFQKGYFRVRPALETEMGMQWHYPFGGNRVAVGAYYGFSYWFSQNPLFNPIVATDPGTGDVALTNTFVQGDLQLQGLRVELEFDF